MANLLSTTVTGTINSSGNVTAPTFVGSLSGNASTATDSNLLDGLDSGSFLRSDANDTFTGTITMGTQHALVANNYGRGVYGTYSATRYQHVWGMGTAYNLADDGTGTGNLYGISWTHSNIGGESIAGLGHQMLIMSNGDTRSAIGDGIWTKYNIYADGGNSTNWNTAFGWGNHAGLYLGATAKAADSELLDGLNSTAYMRDNGWNSNPGQDADTQPGMSSDFSYGNNAPHTGDLIRFGSGSYSLQLSSAYNASEGALSFRTRNGDAGAWNDWRQIYHTGNLNLAVLGYTGATNANYITNNNQLTNGAGYLTSLPSHNHGIGNITDAERWWNNFGQVHSTRTTFDAYGSPLTTGFGWRYVQGSGAGNGPGVGDTGNGQYYALTVGLGDDYASNNYAMQVAIPRVSTNPYLSLRFQEGGALGAWTKISAAYADAAGSVAWSNVTGTPTIPTNNNQLTNGAGYATETWVGEQNYASDTAIGTAIATVTLASLGYTGATNANYITNNNQLTNGAGYITSADGGNAQTLDGIDSSSFLRSDADDTHSGTLALTAITAASGSIANTKGSYLHIGAWGTGRTAADAVLVNTAYRSDILSYTRSFTIGNTARNFNGSANVSWSLADIGAEAAGSAAAVDGRIDNEVLPAIPTNNNQLTNGAGYLTTTGKAADSNLLDGINSSSFLRSDANDTATGNLTFTGNARFDAALTVLNTVPAIYLTESDANSDYAIRNNFGVFNIYDNTNLQNRLSIRSDGNVGIGKTNPSAKLDVEGAITASGDITAFSDARVKENVETIPNALEKVTALRGVNFNKIGEEKRSTGVIAQEVKEVLPEVIHENEDGMLSVAYGNITGVLIEAIKEQQKQIEELKAQLDGLTK